MTQRTSIDHLFKIEISDHALHDLRARLQASRLPTSLDASEWSDGTSLSFMRRLLDHWLHRFDWRAQEERLNLLPNRMIESMGRRFTFFISQALDHRRCRSC